MVKGVIGVRWTELVEKRRGGGLGRGWEERGGDGFIEREGAADSTNCPAMGDGVLE